MHIPILSFRKTWVKENAEGSAHKPSRISQVIFEFEDAETKDQVYLLGREV